MPKLTVTPKRRPPASQPQGATIIGNPPTPGEGFVTMTCGDFRVVISSSSLTKLLGATQLVVINQQHWQLASEFQRAMFNAYTAALLGGKG